MANEIRDIQIKHIINEARIKQAMYSNHKCTADEVIGRTENEKLMILANKIEELEAENGSLESRLLAYNNQNARLLNQIEQLEAKLERVETGLQMYLDGNYTQPSDYRPNNCPHGRYFYDECAECNDEFISGILEALKGNNDE